MNEQKLKEIRIFLASSSTFKETRKFIKDKIEKFNEEWEPKGFRLKLNIWEDMSESIHHQRLQNRYNNEILQSHLFVLLADDTIGKYSEEEFDLAYKEFKNKAKPRIVIIFNKKTWDENKKGWNKEWIDKNLKKFIDKYGFSNPGQEHFFSLYNTKEEIWDKIEKEIRDLLENIFLPHMEVKAGYDKPKKLHALEVPPVPPIFVGRYGVLAKIFHSFFEKKSHDEDKIIMLTGSGGLGKTTIAALYYKEYNDYYSHLIWTNANSGIYEAMVSIANILGVDLKVNFDHFKFQTLGETLGDNAINIQEKAIKEEQIRRIKSALEKLNKPILFVLDNADDYQDLNTNYRYLKNCRKIHFLITSRVKNFELQSEININELSPEEAELLFMSIYQPPRQENKSILDIHQLLIADSTVQWNLSDEEKKLLAEILKAVRYHTLIVKVLAANLKTNRVYGYTMQKLLEDLQSKGVLQLSEQALINSEYHDLQEALPEQIIKALYQIEQLNKEKFFDFIKKWHPEKFNTQEALNEAYAYLQKVMVIFSVLPELVIPYEDIRDFAGDKFYLKAILEFLANLSWLDKNEEGKGFKMNYIVAEIIRDDKKENIFEYLEDLIETLKKETFPKNFLGIYKNYPKASRYISYMISMLSFIKKDTYPIAVLYERIGSFYMAYENIEKSLPYFEKSKEISEKLYDNDPYNLDNGNVLSGSYYNISKIYSKFGYFEEEKYYAELYNQILLDQYNKVKKLETKIMDDDNKLKFGNLIVNIGNSYEILAGIVLKNGDTTKSLDYYKQAIKWKQKSLEIIPNKLSYLNNLSSSYIQLATTYQQIGKYEKAEKYFNKGLSVLNKILNKDSNNLTAQIKLSNLYKILSDFYYQTGKLHLVGKSYEKALELIQSLHHDYPTALDIQYHLAILYDNFSYFLEKNGYPNKARHYYNLYKEILQDLFKKDPNNFNYKLHSFFGSDEQYLNFLKEWIEKNPNDVSLKFLLALTYKNLGISAEKKRKNIEALEYYTQYKNITEELNTLSPENINYKLHLADANLFIGNVYYVQGKENLGENFYQQYIQIIQNLAELYPYNTDLKLKLVNSYQLLAKKGKIAQRLEYLKIAENILKELIEKNPGNTLFKSVLTIILNNFGRIFAEKGELNLAKNYFEQTLLILEKIFSKHPVPIKIEEDIINTMKYIASIYFIEGKFEDAINIYLKLIKKLNDLVNKDKKSISLKETLEEIYGLLGYTYLLTKNKNHAIEYFSKQNEIISKLLKISDDTVFYKILKAKHLKAEVYLSYIKADWKEMKKKYNMYRNYVDELSSKYPGDEKILELKKDDINILYNYIDDNNYMDVNTELFEELYVSQKKLIKQYPQDKWLKLKLIRISLYYLGSLMNTNKMAQAKEIVHSLEKIINELDYNETNNIMELIEMSKAYGYLGKYYKDQGKYNLALQHFITHIKISDKIKSINNKLYYQNMVFYNEVGELFFNLKKYDEALNFYQLSLSHSKKLLAFYPNNFMIHEKLQEDYYNLGQFYETQDNIEKAIYYYKLEEKEYESIYKLIPKNKEVLYDWLNDLIFIAAKLEKKKNYENAIEYLEKALSLIDKNLEKFPNDETLKEFNKKINNYIHDFKKIKNQNNLSIDKILNEFNNYFNQATFYENKRDFNTALKYYLKGYNLLKEKEIITKEPNLIESLIDVCRLIGELYNNYLKDFNLAVKFLECALTNINKLEKIVPPNSERTNLRALIYGKLGRIYKFKKDYSNAYFFFELYNNIMNKLVKNHPNHPGFKINLAISFSDLADTFKEQKKWNKAISYYQKFNQILKKLYEEDPENTRYIDLLLYSYDYLGEAYAKFTIYEQIIKASEYFNKYYLLSLEQVRKDPENSFYLSHLGLATGKLAYQYIRLKKCDKAFSLIVEGLSVFDKLKTKFPTNNSYTNNYKWMQSISDIYQQYCK